MGEGKGGKDGVGVRVRERVGWIGWMDGTLNFLFFFGLFEWDVPSSKRPLVGIGRRGEKQIDETVSIAVFFHFFFFNNFIQVS